jgi:hypothetical protein
MATPKKFTLVYIHTVHKGTLDHVMD